MHSQPERGSFDAQATVWTMIHGAAAGEEASRADFAQRYLPLVRSYLGARWRGSALGADVDDAAQDVFLQCLRAGGVLEGVDAGRTEGFRAFLFGVVRNVARRYELARADTRRPRTETVMPAEPEGDDGELGRLLDLEWARCLVRQAAEHHRRTALARGAAARRGVELLRLRFEEDLPIRAIAGRWGEDPPAVHRLYRRAREEFRRSLRVVVAYHHPGATDLDGECASLLLLLGGE